MCTPTQLVELGFALACEKHEKIHSRWLDLYQKLKNARGNDTPYDAGEHDGRIDCLLREMEDDQRSYILETGKQSGHPNSRTKLQIQLTRYWISSSYEMLRTTSQAVDKESKFSQVITEHKNLFAAYRVPISKQEPHKVGKSGTIQKYVSNEDIAAVTSDGKLVSIETPYEGAGTYRVRPLLDSDTGSIGFVVYDGKSKSLEGRPRRELSDTLLALGDILTD